MNGFTHKRVSAIITKISAEKFQNFIDEIRTDVHTELCDIADSENFCIETEEECYDLATKIIDIMELQISNII